MTISRLSQAPLFVLTARPHWLHILNPIPWVLCCCFCCPDWTLLHTPILHAALCQTLGEKESAVIKCSSHKSESYACGSLGSWCSPNAEFKCGVAHGIQRLKMMEWEIAASINGNKCSEGFAVPPVMPGLSVWVTVKCQNTPGSAVKNERRVVHMNYFYLQLFCVSLKDFHKLISWGIFILQNKYKIFHLKIM